MVRVISSSECPDTQPLMARNEMKVRPTIISWKLDIIIPIRIRLMPLVTIREALRVHIYASASESVLPHSLTRLIMPTNSSVL